MHNLYHSNVSSILYTHGHRLQCTTIHGVFPLLLSPLADSPLPPFCSPFNPLLLTWNPPFPNPPPSKFLEPQLPSASLRQPQEEPGIFYPEHFRLIPLLTHISFCRTVHLALIHAAIQIDIVVRLEVIYDFQATNRSEGGDTSCCGRSWQAPDLHLERARDHAGGPRTAWRADYWRGSARPWGGGGEFHRSHIYLHSSTK